jgi:hypothetical protein
MTSRSDHTRERVVVARWGPRRGSQSQGHFGGNPVTILAVAGIGGQTDFPVAPGTSPIVAYTGSLSQSPTCSGRPASDSVSGTFAVCDLCVPQPN